MSFFTDSVDDRSLRQRTRSSDGYAKLSSDDELDMLPALSTYRNIKTIPKKRSTACASFCCVFSIFGIAFLSIIASMLQHNSPYLKTGADITNKPNLVKGVLGAIIMYVVCLGISSYLLLVNARGVAVVESPRLDD